MPAPGKKRPFRGRKGLELTALLQKHCRCRAQECFRQFASLEEQIRDARADFQKLPREKKDSCVGA